MNGNGNREKLINSNDKISFFRSIPNKEKGLLLINLPKKIQKEIFYSLKNDEIINFLERLDSDEATDLLQIVNNKKRNELLNLLEKDKRDKIKRLLGFDETTAGGLINLDYIQVNINTKINNILKIANNHEKETGKFPLIFVTKDNNYLGELPWHKIWKIKKEEKILKYVKKIPSIIYSADSKTTIEMFKRHSHDKIVVIDENKDILGVIYAHDALKLIFEADSLRRAAGVSKEEDVYDNLFVKTRHRYKWLILNLGTAFLAASVIGLFENTIATLTLLAIYMPVIAGMGGNAGTQTLAVFIRGITLKEIELNKKAMKAIGNEMGAGAINGLITGLIATAIALFLNKNPALGLIVGLSMIFSLIIAGFFGAIIPLIMMKLGKDPATSATIFITTATDVIGFFIFLGLATIVLL